MESNCNNMTASDIIRAGRVLNTLPALTQRPNKEAVMSESYPTHSISLCQCGCGGYVKIATKSCAQKGIKKGFTLRYIYGHSNRINLKGKICCHCGNTYYRKMTPYNEDIKVFENRKYCSPECSALAHLRNNGSNWKGGKRIDRNGYIYILVGRSHHLASKDGYALEHRMVAESIIGRRLKKDEVVHHKNENKHDNSPENLEVLSGNAEHRKIHSKSGRECNEMPEKEDKK